MRRDSLLYPLKGKGRLQSWSQTVPATQRLGLFVSLASPIVRHFDHLRHCLVAYSIIILFCGLYFLAVSTPVFSPFSHKVAVIFVYDTYNPCFDTLEGILVFS